MMLNLVFGGKGVGLMNMIMYVILTVFICGLMIGRTPEYLGKKIEGREMKLTAPVSYTHLDVYKRQHKIQYKIA